MRVEQIIRALGYTVYVALWSPIIVLVLLIAPIAWFAVLTQAGVKPAEGTKAFWTALMNGIRHDIEFIKTGVW